MTQGKFVLFVPAVLALAMSGCGGGSSTEANYVCPQPFTVGDASRLTHFREGAGRDPRDIAYEATLLGAGSTCEVSRNRVDVTLLMRISVSAGPSVAAGRTSVPYFVRVLDESNNVVQSQDFTAEFRLTTGNPRGTSQEELQFSVPRTGAYRIAVGLRPTMEELNYNRRGRQP
jgi:hypothetical protein